MPSADATLFEPARLHATSSSGKEDKVRHIRMGPLMLAAACAVAPIRGRAAESCDGEAAKDRDLNGHRFSRFGIVSWPFVSALVGSRTGYDIARFDVSREVLGRNITATGHFVSVRQAFEAEVKLAPVFALELEANGTGIFGTNGSGALVVGATGAMGGSVGGVLRLAGTEDLSLVARLTLSDVATTSLLPASAIDSVTVNGNAVSFDTSGLFPTGSWLSLTPSVAMAYGLSPLVGFQGSASFALQRVTLGDARDEDATLSLSAGASLDLNHVSVPVSFLLGGEYQRDFGRSPTDLTLDALDSTGLNRGYAEVGLFYIGRPNLELGLLLASEFAGHDDRGFARFRLAYFF
jgi:hypothetical protein